MALANKPWVNRRLDEERKNDHPRRMDWGGGGSGDGKITTDYVFVGGNKLTIPQTGKTDYLKVYLDGVTPPAWVEAMPATQDSDAVVYDVTKNRIQLPGNMGGG